MWNRLEILLIRIEVEVERDIEHISHILYFYHYHHHHDSSEEKKCELRSVIHNRWDEWKRNIRLTSI